MKHPIILKHFKKAEEEISPDRLCSRGFAAPPPTSDFQPDIRGIKVVKQQNNGKSTKTMGNLQNNGKSTKQCEINKTRKLP